MVQICRAGDLPLGGPRLAGPTTPHYPRWVWPFDRRAREARAAQRFPPREEPSTGPVRGAGIGRSTLLEYPARSPPDLQVLRTAAVELTPRCSSVRAPLSTTCTTCSRKLGMISRTQLARYVVEQSGDAGPFAGMRRGAARPGWNRRGPYHGRSTGPHCALGAPGRSPMTQRPARDQPAHVAVPAVRAGPRPLARNRARRGRRDAREPGDSLHRSADHHEKFTEDFVISLPRRG